MIEQMQTKLDAAAKQMKKVLDHLQSEFASIRAGRANPAVLDKIQADYYGVPTPLNQLANIAVSEGRNLLITPFDPSTIRAITKAILASDLGITPTDDGKTIRLAFPQPTEDRRKELAKTIKKYGEEAKVAVRNARRDLVEDYKKMKKNSEITEDDLKSSDKKVQTLTDRYIDEIDSMVSSKEKEIMSI